MNIQNKVVLVTGASRGIGMAIATELSDKGAIVIGTATSVDGASNISKTLSAKERKGEGMVLDVNNNDSITNLNKAINDKIIFGAGLDVFEKEPVDINNPLLKNNKVLLSPHSATFTNECKSRMSLETTKNIIDFVGLSAITPGLTVAKNEGYKTVISIRGVGDETNQTAIAAPSVALHMDGIFVASKFSLRTDFIDIERVEVLRGPQGTLFGQNSTGGTINVISKMPSSDGFEGKADLTLGNYGLVKSRGSFNFPISDKVSTRNSFVITERDGFSDNVINGQDLDDASHISLR